MDWKLYIILLVVILLAIWNGLVIDWKVNNHIYRSKEFHAVGLAIRLVLLPLFYGYWLELSIYCIVCYPIYNMIIAHFMGQNIFYTGTTSTIDRVLGKLNPYIYILLGIITITLSILKLLHKI